MSQKPNFERREEQGLPNLPSMQSQTVAGRPQFLDNPTYNTHLTVAGSRGLERTMCFSSRQGSPFHHTLLSRTSLQKMPVLVNLLAFLPFSMQGSKQVSVGCLDQSSTYCGSRDSTSMPLCIRVFVSNRQEEPRLWSVESYSAPNLMVDLSL